MQCVCVLCCVLCYIHMCVCVSLQIFSSTETAKTTAIRMNGSAMWSLSTASNCEFSTSDSKRILHCHHHHHHHHHHYHHHHYHHHHHHYQFNIFTNFCPPNVPDFNSQRNGNLHQLKRASPIRHARPRRHRQHPHQAETSAQMAPRRLVTCLATPLRRRFMTPWALR